MYQSILLYLLIGVGVSFLLEYVVRWTGDEVKMGERVVMITLWPIMAVYFVYNFIKGFFS